PWSPVLPGLNQSGTPAAPTGDGPTHGRDRGGRLGRGHRPTDRTVADAGTRAPPRRAEPWRTAGTRAPPRPAVPWRTAGTRAPPRPAELWWMPGAATTSPRRTGLWREPLRDL